MLFRNLTLVALIMLCAPAVRADVPPNVARKLYDRVTPSLVVVQYTWDSELGRRELVGAGVVVGETGLVMTSVMLFSPEIPDEQMTDFKIIVPRTDEDAEELDAVFVGRDERTQLAFVRTKESRTWPVIRFEDVRVDVGDPVMSVSLLPKEGGYRSYFTQGTVSATLRGPVPFVLVGSGGLGAVGSLVFNGDGKAVGFVNVQQDQSAFLNFLKSPLATVTEPPRLFVPSRDFLQSFTDPPVEGKPLVLPWTGLGQLSGLRKDVAEFFGLTNQAAVEITDVIPGAAAAKAGLKRGQVVTKINGKPLERGDEPDELPQIVQRQILRMNVGEPITFTVIDRPGQPARDVTFPLLEQPKRANVARRYWAEDLGFGVREIVFADTYFKKLSPDQKGVLISLIKPNGAAANAQLRGSDVVTEINGQAVADIEQFKTLYEESRKLKAAEAMKLLVLRDGNTQVIRIEPPQ